jgi:hypothetical protein
MSITTSGRSLRHSIFGASIDMLDEKSDGVPLLTLLLSDLTWKGAVNIVNSISARDIGR